jgi:hypothetical protein
VLPQQAIKLLDSIYKDPQNSPKDHPVEFIKHFFDSTLWSKQEEVIYSVKDHPKTAVRSANTVGKSNVAAKIALWFLLAYQPSKVIITAPTFTQIEEILFKEIATLYNHCKIPIGGELLKTELKFSSDWFALGISTNEVNRFQGFHSPYMLVIIDEALGVDPMIWEAIEGLHPYRILAIGNPLSPEGEFFKCFSNPSWHKIGISALDCVRWQQTYGKIPGLVTLEWCEERASEWGVKSPLYISRVLGEFPQEGSDVLIHLDWLDRARKNKIEVEYDFKIVACDVARYGEDKTSVIKRNDHKIYGAEIKEKIPTTMTAGIVKRAYEHEEADSLVVDDDGVGGGVTDMLRENHIGVLAFKNGSKQIAIDSNHYANLKSQFYHIVAKKFEQGLYDLTELSQLHFEMLKNQLCATKYVIDSMGRMKVESKEDLKARGLVSPDLGDAFIMSEYAFFMGRQGDIKPVRWR